MLVGVLMTSGACTALDSNFRGNRYLTFNTVIRVNQIEVSAYNDAQLLGYDEFWDAVRVEKTIVSDALRKGLEQGREQGREQGQAAERIKNARKMKAKGYPAEDIAEITGLSVGEIAGL